VLHESRNEEEVYSTIAFESSSEFAGFPVVMKVKRGTRFEKAFEIFAG
jgi:hypothetical protein